MRTACQTSVEGWGTSIRLVVALPMYVWEPRTQGMNMNPRVKVLKQLVADGHYVIDEAAIAETLMLRSMVLRALPDMTFRCAPPAAPPVRSFRPHPGARSFRLSGAIAGRCICTTAC